MPEPVHATALGADDAVFEGVLHAHAVAPADLVGKHHGFERGNVLAVNLHHAPLDEAEETCSGLSGACQGQTPMVGSTIVMEVSMLSKSSAS